MIEFFIGKTGGGKSYLALREIAQFLANHPDGYVVTNLSIQIGKLNALLKRRHPAIEPDVVGRVRLLTDLETRQFYLHRERGNDLAPVSKEDERELRFPDFNGAARRSCQVLYVVDEAHIFFDAREWANVGLTLNFFASQHRKFRCDVIFITQFLDQVEKRLRNHSTQFRECQNWGMRRLAWWKLPSVFRVRLTYKAPPCPPEHTETHRIDPELAECYDTTAGVGVVGGFKPDEKRRKGLPFWTLPAAVAVGLFGLGFSPEIIGWYVRRAAGDADRAAVVSAGGVPSVVAREDSAAVASPPPPPSTPSTPTTAAPTVDGSPVVRVVGYAARSDRALVWLSDGRVLTESHPAFGGIDRRGTGVWVDGRFAWMVRPWVPPPPPVRENAANAKETAPDAILPAPEYHGEALFAPDPAIGSWEKGSRGGTVGAAGRRR